MKRILALVLLAVLSLAVAGCGSTSVRVSAKHHDPDPTLSGSITVTGQTATFPNVKAGTRIACKSLPGLSVTAPATGASVTGRSSGKGELGLKRLPNGSIRVYCTAPR